MRPGDPLFKPAERAFLRAVGRLAFSNPFLPERVDAERDALAGDFVDPSGLWTPGTPDENGARIDRLLRPLLASARDRIAARARAGDEDRALYEDGCHYLLYRSQPTIDEVSPGCAARYRAFLADHDRLFRFPGSTHTPPDPALVFACGFQIQRALHRISTTLIGASRPMAALRAAVWHAIFTCDLRDYVAAPEGCMDDISTLVTGPTGTGKELVARGIGLSGYIAFDAGALRFAAPVPKDLSAVNLAALSGSLIESELFGHERGSFTGAVKDHRGWLESCERGAALFLDEIGELDPAAQVKLLRVLETRIFQRLGDTETRRFAGRILSATHRDLAEKIAEGTFRHDLYRRLCACSIRTPTLREQLDDAPGERRRLVRYIAGQVRARKADALTDLVERWIDEELPPDYAWPGNVRELFQCVREIFVSKSYQPLDLAGDEEHVEEEKEREGGEDDDDPVKSIRAGTLSEDQVLGRYATIVQARTRNVAETARVLGVHRHTVMRRLDHALLARLSGYGGKAGARRGGVKPPRRKRRST